MMQSAAAAGLAAFAPAASAAPARSRFEAKDTPKICLEPGLLMTPDEAAVAKRVKQLGVDYVMGVGGGRMPWEEERLKAVIDRWKGYGLTVGHMMIGGLNNVTYGRAGKDQDIENMIKSIRAAGKAGLPVIEYNWYAHRASEGYFEESGRAGAGWTGFDYEREIDEGGKKIKVKDLPPRPNEGARTAEEMWANITYFLKAVVPEAEKAGVRLALPPNDPPAPVARGSQQIMGTVEGWKKLVNIVKSPYNGITFDSGVTREMGADAAEVCKYFADRDCINHVHYRNVKVQKPYERYAEVFIDEGENDMFAVMKVLVKSKYPRLVYPEHARGLDYDRERQGFRPLYPGGGGYAAFAFNVGFTRAMLQAALVS
ncbi:MAG: mannonate dehydratase, partial [Acidobacteriia bacterium]|nr:mannonate dehydratase [Terriglobia bacterium]